VVIEKKDLTDRGKTTLRAVRWSLSVTEEEDRNEGGHG